MDRLESRVREGVRSLLVSSTESAVAVVGVGWRILVEGVVLEGGHGWQGSETAAEGDEKDWESLENGRGKDRNWDGKWKLVATQLGMRRGGEASFYTGGAGETRDKVGFEAGRRRSS